MAASALSAPSNVSITASVPRTLSSPAPLLGPGLCEDGRSATRAEVTSSTEGIPRTLTKYVPLRPKPASETPGLRLWESKLLTKLSQSRKSDPNRLRSRPRCLIKSCQAPYCRLRTHRDFSQLLKATPNPKTLAKNADQSCSKSHTASEQTPTCAAHSAIFQHGVDGLPALPLDGLEGTVFRELFHSFFSYQYDRIRRIMCPPPISDDQKQVAAQTKHQTLRLALSSPLHCLNYIAATHHQVVLQRGSPSPDQTTALLYGKVTALLRTKLSSYNRFEISDIIKVILTLVMFEITHGRTQSLSLHRKAVKKIIDTYGGLHDMGDSIWMIQTLDRIFCIMLCSPALHGQPPDQLIRKPAQFPPSYGAWLELPVSKKVLDQQTHEFCVDVCRAVEIVEGEDWSFDPTDSALSSSSNSHYFFFLRKCCAHRFVQLNASMANDYTIARCVLLATKIVEYKVCYDGYFAAFAVAIANRIQAILSRAGTELSWTDHGDILNWVLFVQLTVSDFWDGQPWAINLLIHQIDQKYAYTSWPDEWRQLELANVRRFVWSDTRLNPIFMRICSQLLPHANKNDNIRLTHHKDNSSSPVVNNVASGMMAFE